MGIWFTWMTFRWCHPTQLAWLSSGLTGTLLTDQLVPTAKHRLPGTPAWSVPVWAQTTHGSSLCCTLGPGTAPHITLVKPSVEKICHHSHVNPCFPERCTPGALYHLHLDSGRGLAFSRVKLKNIIVQVFGIYDSRKKNSYRIQGKTHKKDQSLRCSSCCLCSEFFFSPPLLQVDPPLTKWCGPNSGSCPTNTGQRSVLQNVPILHIFTHSASYSAFNKYPFTFFFSNMLYMHAIFPP